MKKILIILIALLCFSTNPMVSYASDNGININTSVVTNNKQVKPGDIVDLVIKITGASNNLASGDVTLNFDNTKFEYMGFNMPVGYTGGDANCVNGKVIYSYYDNDGGASAIKGEHFVTFKFKVKQVADSSSIIKYTLRGVSDKDGNRYTLASNSSSITLNIHTPSSNNYLSSITVSSGKLTPIFNKNTTNYTVNVDSNVTEIEINATKEDSLSNFRGTGKKKLNYGENNFDILVESEAGKIRQYKIKVNRKDDRNGDATLRSLNVTNINFKFTGNLTYKYEVENDVAEVYVSGEVNNPKSTLTGTGTRKLNVGTNNIVVKVTAENGITKNYVITIVRKKKVAETVKKSDNNYLKTLNIDGIDFVFDKDVSDYEITVPHDFTRVLFNYEREDTTSKVEVLGGEGLMVGFNSKTVLVVAENGAQRQYKFNIIRKDNKSYVENDKNKILEAIKNQEAINVRINPNDKPLALDKEIIEALKSESKNLTFSWYDNNSILQKELNLFHSLLNSEKMLKPNIKDKVSNDKLLKFINGRDYIGINISDTNIPSKAIYKVKLENPKKDYLLCYLENDKVKSVPANIYNGYLEVRFNDAKEYVLVEKIKEVKRENKYMWVMPVLVITIIGLVLAIVAVLFNRKI